MRWAELSASSTATEKRKPQRRLLHKLVPLPIAALYKMKRVE